jgi:hypothetical protein
MQILKSLGDGIGTGAGVAWPTFGIIFGTLGLTIGASTIAIILGSITTALFFLVALPITYWSYKNYLKETEELKLIQLLQEEKISENLFDYLISISSECLYKNSLNNPAKRYVFIEEIIYSIQKDIAENEQADIPCPALSWLYENRYKNNILKDFVHAINTTGKVTLNYKPVLDNEKKSNLLQQIAENYNQQNSFSPTPLSLANKIKTGLIAFSAGFGSIAGCSAGTLGLLASMGVISGLAAVPIVGWTILGLAIVFGVAVAGVCICSSSERDRQNQAIAHYKSLNQKLVNITTVKNIKTNAKIEVKEQINNNRLADSYGKRVKKNYSRTNNLDHANYSFWMPQKVTLGHSLITKLAHDERSRATFVRQS